MSDFKRYKVRTQYFFKDMYGDPFKLTEGQLQIFDLVYNPNILRASIKCPSQYGKSDVTSMAIIMAMLERKERILIIAPTEKQAGIIMGDVIKHFFDNKYISSMIEYSGRLEQLQSERSKKRITTKNGSEVMILTANVDEIKKESKNLVGFGATMIVIDERPLIPDTIWGKILRMIGGAKAGKGKIVMLGNAFPDSEQFKKSFLPNSLYTSLSIDWRQALAEGRYTKDFLDEAKEDITEYDWLVFYECVFPTAGADNSVIPMAWIQVAIDQKDCESDYKQAGLDVARFGRDKTVYMLRKGNRIVKIEMTQQLDNMEAAGWCSKMLDDDEPEVLNIDVIGIGSGVYDRLNELGYNVEPINAAESPSEENKEKFYNKRAEMFWNLRDMFKPDKQGRSQVSIPNDNELVKELSQIQYKYSSDKKIKIEDKEEMKKRLGRSPDKADALALTFYKNEDEALLMFA